MTPVAGATTPMAPLPEVEGEAAAPDADEAEDRAEDIRLAEELEARDMVVGAVMLDAVAEADSASALAPDSVGLGAAPDPPPEAETAPRSAASPVAAAPPPVAVRVGAW